MKHIRNGPDHPRVLCYSAAEKDRRLNRESTDDYCFIIANHGIAEPQKNVRSGNTFLLAVDDIGFGKHRAAAGEAGDARSLLCQCRIVFDGKIQPGHLIFKKAAGASCAVLIYGKLRNFVQIRNKTGALAADFYDAPCVWRKQSASGYDRGDFLAKSSPG